MDGSPGSFYFHEATGDVENDTKWLIFIEGGGWCYDDLDCVQRSKTMLGSSTFNTYVYYIDCKYIYVENETRRPEG